MGAVMYGRRGNEENRKMRKGRKTKRQKSGERERWGNWVDLG